MDASIVSPGTRPGVATLYGGAGFGVFAEALVNVFADGVSEGNTP